MAALISRTLLRWRFNLPLQTSSGAQLPKENKIRAIAARYKHYVNSEKKRLRKRLERKINAQDRELRKRYEQAKSVRTVGIDDFVDFVLAREPRCECCGKPLDMTIGSTDFAIDHFHDSGLLRGLLCNQCNLGLGSFNDDVETVKRAKAYLEHHHAKRNMP